MERGSIQAPPIDLSEPIDTSTMVERYCILKKIPSPEAIVAYGARIGARKIGTIDVPCIEIPMYCAPGVVCGRFDCSPDTSYLDKGKTKQGEKNGLFISNGGHLAPGVVYVVEGVKDAATLHHYGLQAIGMQGTSLAKKRKIWNEFFNDSARQFQVVAVPDLDTAGKEAARHLVDALAGLPGVESIRYAKLPGPERLVRGLDVRDCIANDGWDVVRQTIENPLPIPSSEKPIILDRVDERQNVVDESYRALAALGWDSPWIDEPEREPAKVYNQVGAIVEVVIDEGKADAKGFFQPPRPRIRAVDRFNLSVRLSQAARFRTEKIDKDQNIETAPCPPPGWLVPHMLTSARENSRWLPRLNGLVSAPTIRHDGSILQVPGYDQASGLILLPGDYPTIPDRVTQADVMEAMQHLYSVVEEFDFDQDYDFPSWLAYLLTLLARPSINGCVPSWVFTATMPRSGKGLLVNIANLIATGRVPGKRAYKKNDEEFCKAVSSALRSGAVSFNVDNIRQTIDSEAFEAAATAKVWEDRILGGMEDLDVPQSLVFSFTGNHVRIAGDAYFRMLSVKLSPKCADPHLRQFKRSEDLEDYVERDRMRLLRSALVILRNRHLSDRQKPLSQPLGGFARWDWWVRDAVLLATEVWNGGPNECMDPLWSSDRLAAVDQGKEALKVIHRFINAVQSERQTYLPGGSVSSRWIAQVATGNAGRVPEVWRQFAVELLAALGFQDPAEANPIAIGKRLESHADVHWGGQVLRKCFDRHSNSAIWEVWDSDWEWDSFDSPEEPRYHRR
jgi:hypothetical protein